MLFYRLCCCSLLGSGLMDRSVVLLLDELAVSLHDACPEHVCLILESAKGACEHRVKAKPEPGLIAVLESIHALFALAGVKHSILVLVEASGDEEVFG